MLFQESYTLHRYLHLDEKIWLDNKKIIMNVRCNEIAKEIHKIFRSIPKLISVNFFFFRTHRIVFTNAFHNFPFNPLRLARKKEERVHLNRGFAFRWLEKLLVTGKWNDGLALFSGSFSGSASGREDLCRRRKLAPIKCSRAHGERLSSRYSGFSRRKFLGKWKGAPFPIHKRNVFFPPTGCTFRFHRFSSTLNFSPPSTRPILITLLLTQYIVRSIKSKLKSITFLLLP